MIWILIIGAYALAAASMITALWRRTPPVKAPMPDFSEAQVIWNFHSAKVAHRTGRVA